MFIILWSRIHCDSKYKKESKCKCNSSFKHYKWLSDWLFMRKDVSYKPWALKSITARIALLIRCCEKLVYIVTFGNETSRGVKMQRFSLTHRLQREGLPLFALAILMIRQKFWFLGFHLPLIWHHSHWCHCHHLYTKITRQIRNIVSLTFSWIFLQGNHF